MGLFKEKKLSPSSNSSHIQKANFDKIYEDAKQRAQDATTIRTNEEKKIVKLNELQGKFEDVIQNLKKAQNSFSDSEETFLRHYVSDTATKQSKKFNEAIEDIECAIKELNNATKDIELKIKKSNQTIADCERTINECGRILQSLP